MTGFILTPAALQDLEEIWDYIAADNPQAAARVLDVFEGSLSPTDAETRTWTLPR